MNATNRRCEICARRTASEQRKAGYRFLQLCPHCARMQDVDAQLAEILDESHDEDLVLSRGSYLHPVERAEEQYEGQQPLDADNTADWDYAVELAAIRQEVW